MAFNRLERKSPTKSYQRSSSSIGSPTKSSPRSTSSIGSPIKSINVSIENETDSSIQDIELNTDILNKKQNIVLPAGAHVHNSYIAFNTTFTEIDWIF